MKIQTVLSRSLLALLGLACVASFTGCNWVDDLFGNDDEGGGGGGGVQAGQFCEFCRSGTATEIRVQILNANDVHGVQMTVSGGGENCKVARGACEDPGTLIWELPFADSQGNRELGQALLELTVGDSVTFSATGALSAQQICRVTQEGVDFGTADAVLEAGTIRCGGGFQNP